MNQDTIKLQEHLKINGLVYHAISQNGQYIAVSLKQGPSIEIYKMEQIEDTNTWKLVHRLKEQQQTISSIDWFGDNTLLSTSHDRSVLVWKLQDNLQKWDKELVIIESQRAVLCGEWSNNGMKFAVGGGDAKCFLGYYDQDAKHWQTLSVAKTESSVTAVKFHPSDRLLAVGSTDQSIQIVSCYLEEADKQNSTTSYNGPFNKVNSCKEIIYNFKNSGGWVEDLSFNNTGNKLVIALHNGTCLLITLNDEQNIDRQKNEYLVKKLPYKQIVHSKQNENILIGAGYDMVPVQISYGANQEQLQFEKNLENTLSKVVKTQKSKVQQLQNNMFKTTQGKQTQGLHTTPILCLQTSVINGKNLVSTSDMNGTLLFWNI